MTIWILTLLLMASVAGLGYRQGAIRAGFSFLGIVVGALLALPLGHLIHPLFRIGGLANPLVAWSMPPLLGFALVLTAFKIGGGIVHKKVEVFYKYRGGDLRLSLWERLNRRVGLSVGLCNGAAYLVLISWVVFAASYWTCQFATPTDRWTLNLLNRLGHDLEITGLSKVAGAIDRNPGSYYDTADAAGTVFQTPLVEARLSRYPALLGLAEQPEIRDLAADKEFSDLRQQSAPLAALLANPKAQAVLKNPETMKAIQAAIVPNVQDLTNFLATGRSGKFDSEPFVGRWNIDLNGSLLLLRKDKPNLSANVIAQNKRMFATFYPRVVLIATPEHKVFLKNLPQAAATPGSPANAVVNQGQWNEVNGKYELTVAVDATNQRLSGELNDSRLTLTGIEPALAFIRED